MEQRIFCPRLFDGRQLHHNMLLCLRAGRIASIMDGASASATVVSLRLPADTELRTYGELMTEFKLSHNATIVAVADDALGKGLTLNAPASKHVGPGQTLYYIAQHRIV